nr:uncharacterized protein K02A2.6-like [Dermacentor andersoni]
MELDTGAAVSVMSHYQAKVFFPGVHLQPTKMQLKTYTGDSVKPVAVMDVLVRHNNQQARLPLYIVPQGSIPLLGRNWLQHIRLDWGSIGGLCKVSAASGSPPAAPEMLLRKNEDLFKDELRTIQGEQASLQFTDDKGPRFLKARSVPFALVKRVQAELEKLEKLRIISHVASSKYATPIVPVVKRDGSVRICGDCELTLNPILDVETYPLPKLDELLGALTGGQKFTKIDLGRAYHQVEMVEEPKAYLTLNTPRGLYVVNRLPFGIASAPATFQKIVHNVLKVVDGVTCYIDDIMVTGKTEQKHLKNSDAVLIR